MKGFSYHQPQSLAEVFSWMEKIPQARLIAGGTDLMVRIKNREVVPEALVSLRRVDELGKIQKTSGMSLGALTTIQEIIRHPALEKGYPVLVQAARRLGSTQIRNVATLGGNLCNCSPCADTACALLVLDAKAQIQSSQEVRELPLVEFFQGPGKSCLKSGEILTRVVLPPPEPDAQAIFMKKGRVKMDLAIASLSVWIQMKKGQCQKVRIAAGSVAPIPLRLVQVEKLLEGKPLTDEWVSQASQLATQAISPITDLRASEEYRRHLIGIYLQRSLRLLGRRGQ